ncbi:CpaD family pilus assembly protein [Dongia sp.]|uniref:CpaD family pilus assembly protein n=1 Tax=Dongia sp. TaxID=1977262 RepID=UPI0035B491F4
MLRHVAIVALCLAGLSACEADMPNYDYATRYPIKVETRTALLILEPGPGGHIKPMDVAAIDEFARDYANRSAGGITLQIGANSISDALATGFAADIGTALSGRGVPVAAVQTSFATDPESAKYGRAILQFPIYVAIADECGSFKDQPGFTPLNENSYGFGCANQRNLAAMVVNPRDLIDAQASSGRLAARSADVVGKYIIGSKIGGSAESPVLTIVNTTGGL